MGQANTRPSSSAPDDTRDTRRRSLRPTSWAPSLLGRPDDTDDSNNTNHSNNTNTNTTHGDGYNARRRMSQRINPFHRFSSHPSPTHDAGSSTPSTATPTTPARRPSRLTRARSSLGSLGDLLHSRPPVSHRSTEPVYSLAAAAPLTPAGPRAVARERERERERERQSPTERGPSLPHVPSMADLDLDFDSLLAARTNTTTTNTTTTTPRDRSDSIRTRPPPTPSSLRRDGRALSMLPRLRNTLGSSRRRRSLWHDDDNMDSIERLRRGEDQADVLSRLLSLAAAATAASLVGEDHQAATRDGTFDTFLQSLQNGSIASALRGNEGGEGGDTPGGTPAPLNFFRMFRFGTATAPARDSREPSRGPGSGSGSDAQDGDDDGEGRMVPIIIVGIRSINPASGAGHDDGNIPPFLDALSSFPTPPTSPGDNDTILRPQNGTRFSHRRRASMGGFNFPSNYDSQRHHRTRPQEPRPLSPSLADSPPGPQPPPSTPATNAALSADPSGSTTPTATPPSSTPQSTAPSRRGSFVRRSPASTLEPTEEEEPQTQPRSSRQRRLSESDFTRYGAGAPRRRGVVEPDNNPGEGSRSWIIYVLGGSYPENHPILTTPSLFTDSPTYEDMMLLSSILGPAKAPVASEGDVAAAPGLFKIVRNVTGLVAEEVHGEESIPLAGDARCLVCLCDFEAEEEARKLVKCEHLFHKICIDQWLTTGRNSCPLCRGQGVDESSAPELEPPAPPSSTPMPPELAA